MTTLRAMPAIWFAFVLGLACVASCSSCENTREASDRAEPQAQAKAKQASGAPSSREASPKGQGRDDAGNGPRLVRRSRQLMGTTFRITVAGHPRETAWAAAGDALDEIARLEQVLSEWIDDSDISRINAAAGERPVEVGKHALAVVQAGIDVSRWSGGAFDLSWAALRGLYDFRPGHHRIPARAQVKKRLDHIDWKAIAVRPDERQVLLEREGMAIGTGGIGKGYALDHASRVLTDAGIEDFMIFGGGQVHVHGKKGDRPWRVGIQHPRDPGSYFAFFEASEGSISTSGDYQHAFVDDEGRRWHHIIDPRTGLPAKRSLSVTVLSTVGLYADALSTAAFVVGPDKASEILRKAPGRTEMVMIDADCQLVTTEGTREQLHMTTELEDGRLPHCTGY